MAQSEPDHRPKTGPDARGELDHGDVVVDRDRDDSRAVVVSRPSKTAEDWHVPGRGTVAEDNPAYSADDRVVCVVFRDTLTEAYPYYCGIKPLALSALNDSDVKFYAFPESRLRAVGRMNNPLIDLTDVRPSPYHARSFRAADNRGFIQQIRRRGDLAHQPLLRPVEHGFEVLNGHKRIWAAHVAGLDRITARCIYCSDEQAARTFVNAHLDSYTLGRGPLNGHMDGTDL
jgi:ParB family chromosome partitioning protein